MKRAAGGEEHFIHALPLEARLFAVDAIFNRAQLPLARRKLPQSLADGPLEERQVLGCPLHDHRAGEVIRLINVPTGNPAQWHGENCGQQLDRNRAPSMPQP